MKPMSKRKHHSTMCGSTWWRRSSLVERSAWSDNVFIISVNWKNFPRMTAAAGLLFCSFSWVSFSPVPEFIHCLPNGGAGALVPITGFANSVAAPAIEYKKEGQVFGIGCKIFTIAGPVILYGIVTSWALGVVYWVWTLMWSKKCVR